MMDLSKHGSVPQRTLVAYVEDRPGVLNRVSSLFRRRSYNIVSLTVGRTNEPGWSRMTIVVEADKDVARRIEANLYKLVNVVSVEDITDKAHVIRDLALIKVRTTREQRAELCQLAESYRARVVDIGDDAVTLEMTGRLEKIDAFCGALAPFGILEMVLSGAIGMTRGGQGAAASHARESREPGVA